MGGIAFEFQKRPLDALLDFLVGVIQKFEE